MLIRYEDERKEYEQLKVTAKLYDELTFAVKIKGTGETLHQAALRLIKEGQSE